MTHSITKAYTNKLQIGMLNKLQIGKLMNTNKLQIGMLIILQITSPVYFFAVIR